MGSPIFFKMSLPILSSLFFEKNRPTAAHFQQWQALASWSESFMPVYEWDNVIYVACAKEPTLHIQTDKKIVFVFCEAGILKSLWEELNESPQGLSLTTHIPSAAPQSASFDDIQADDQTVTIEASEENPAGMPEGLSLDIGSKSPLEATSILRSSAQLVADDLFAAEEAQEEAAPVAAIPEKDPSEGTKTIAGYTKITSASSTEEEIFDGILSEMEKNFSKCMLLVAQPDKNNEVLKPYKWNSRFSKSNPSAKATAIPLNLPSPFRVIFRTQKSYHGYIVPNDQNDQFFAEWNESQIPDHMTLSPILVDDVVVGAILGLGDKNADNKATLLQTEHLCEAVAKKFRSQPQLMKAS